jgi:hypothetical protein
MRLMEHVEFMGEVRNSLKSLVGKSDWKRPVWRIGVDGRTIFK